MSRRFLKDGVLWGLGLWFIGYFLGMVFFMVVPKEMIGWFVMPVGVVITLWVLMKKVKGKSLDYYLKIAAVWTIIAIVLDYFFIVMLLKTGNEYYKFDVYLYYLLTFLLPLIIGWKRNQSNAKMVR